MDAFNEMRHLRARPLVGLQILELIPNGDKGWAGFLYRPDDGKSYAATAFLEKDGQLSISACVLGNHMCASDTWTRTND